MNSSRLLRACLLIAITVSACSGATTPLPKVEAITQAKPISPPQAAVAPASPSPADTSPQPTITRQPPSAQELAADQQASTLPDQGSTRGTEAVQTPSGDQVTTATIDQTPTEIAAVAKNPADSMKTPTQTNTTQTSQDRPNHALVAQNRTQHTVTNQESVSTKASSHKKKAKKTEQVDSASMVKQAQPISPSQAAVEPASPSLADTLPQPTITRRPPSEPALAADKQASTSPDQDVTKNTETVQTPSGDQATTATIDQTPTETAAIAKNPANSTEAPAPTAAVSGDQDQANSTEAPAPTAAVSGDQANSTETPTQTDAAQTPQDHADYTLVAQNRTKHTVTDQEPVSTKASSNKKKTKKIEPVDGVNMVNAVPLAQDGIHDPKSPGLALLQNPAQALSQIPVGKWGEADWIQALEKGVIDPRADIQGKSKMEVLDLDIIMKNTKSMPHIRFPHKSHTRWLACKNCHPDIFKPKAGTNALNMNDIFRGRFCGVCHGKVAFSIYVCQRCHSIPHKDSPSQWW